MTCRWTSGCRQFRPCRPLGVWALPLGGLLLGLITWTWARRRPGPAVDPVEANALHGGRMSTRDSLFVGLQSVLSNGFGASVGLEAAYAQLGAGFASLTGGALNLRRSDLRAFVGAGAGAGIAAAFGAPLTGAFYAFEIIIGSYTVANIAPVVAATLAGALVSRLLHAEPMVIHAEITDTLSNSHYLLFAMLGPDLRRPRGRDHAPGGLDRGRGVQAAWTEVAATGPGRRLAGRSGLGRAAYLVGGSRGHGPRSGH